MTVGQTPSVKNLSPNRRRSLEKEPSSISYESDSARDLSIEEVDNEDGTHDLKKSNICDEVKEEVIEIKEVNCEATFQTKKPLKN